MADWLDDEISSCGPNGGSCEGDGEGFVKLLIIGAVLFVIIRFILPLFGVEFNPL